AIGHRIVVGHRLATGSADLGHHLVGSRSAGTFAMGAATQVVDHYSGTVPGKQQRMGATETTASTGNDHNLIFKTDGFTHGRLLTVCKEPILRLSPRAVQGESRPE